jgi:hypothetical protein
MFETLVANELEYAEAERLMRKLLARHPLDMSVRVIGTMHNLLVHQLRLEAANANVGARDKAA